MISLAAPGMAPWTLALLLDRLSGRPSFSPSPTIGASVLALRNPSPGLYFPELPSLHRRHGKRWVHRRFWRHHPRRRRPTNPAPSNRRQLLWIFYPNYFSRRVAVYAADRAHFTATDIAGAFNDQRLWTSTASTAPLPSAKTTPSPVRTRGAATSPFQTNYLVSSDHRPFISALTTSSADTTTPLLPAWNAFPYPLKTTLSFSIGPFLEPLHHRFPQRSWPHQDRRPAYTLRTFTTRQLRIRESASPRYGEPSSQGIIEFRPPPFFVFTPVAALTTVFSSLECVFSFGF